jgi:hypothetical protein
VPTAAPYTGAATCPGHLAARPPKTRPAPLVSLEPLLPGTIATCHAPCLLLSSTRRRRPSRHHCHAVPWPGLPQAAASQLALPLLPFLYKAMQASTRTPEPLPRLERHRHPLQLRRAAAHREATAPCPQCPIRACHHLPLHLLQLMHPAIVILPQWNAYIPSYTAAAPPWPPLAATLRGAPYSGLPPREPTPRTEAPRPPETLRPIRSLLPSPEHGHRRPEPLSPAPLRRPASFDPLPTSHGHPKVALELLSLSPHLPLAAGDSPRREPPATHGPRLDGLPSFGPASVSSFPCRLLASSRVYVLHNCTPLDVIIFEVSSRKG